jgi:hypothetical protein
MPFACLARIYKSEAIGILRRQEQAAQDDNLDIFILVF